MAVHYEELPEGMGFPNPDDMRQWQLLFEKAVTGGNRSELIGFKLSKGHVVGICRYKDDRNAGRTRNATGHKG